MATHLNLMRELRILERMLPHTSSSCGAIKHRDELNSTPVSLISIAGDGVQLGPLGTAATDRPIVPAPGDYDDGEIGGIIGKLAGET
jgi:hypothetical protein